MVMCAMEFVCCAIARRPVRHKAHREDSDSRRGRLVQLTNKIPGAFEPSSLRWK